MLYVIYKYAKYINGECKKTYSAFSMHYLTATKIYMLATDKTAIKFNLSIQCTI